MSDTEQQSFQAWLRNHFRFDSHDLAEISNLIAVPGLPDVDMPDVLSLLAEEDSMPQPGMSNQYPSASRNSLDSAVALAGMGSLPQALGQSDAAARLQSTTVDSMPLAGTQHQSPFHIRLQPQQTQQPVPQNQTANVSLQQQLQQQNLPGSSWPQQQQQHQQQQRVHQQQFLQQATHLPQQQEGFRTQDWQQMPYQSAAARQQTVTTAATSNAGSVQRSYVPAEPAAAATGAAALPELGQLGYNSTYTPITAVAYSAAVPAVAAPAGDSTQAWTPHHQRNRSSRTLSSGDYDPSYSDSQSLSGAADTNKATKKASAGRGTARGRPAAASRRGGAAGTAAASAAGHAAAAAAAAGVGKRRKRKPSEAQRQAHRRFRQRRKEQMVTLEQEVAEKQAQLEALSLEHMALQAKARALDQLVASADDGMALLQQLEQLSISQKQQQQVQQQQQQLPTVEELQDSQSSQQQQQHSASGNEADVELSPESSSATVAASVARDASGNHSGSLQHLTEQQQDAAGPDLKQEPSSPDGQAAASVSQQRQLEQEQMVHILSMRSRTALDGVSGSNCWRDAAAELKAQAFGQSNRINTIGSVEHLEARLKGVLPLPTYDPVQLLPAADRIRVRDELPKLRTLLKSFVSEVMQLILQIQQETGQGSGTWAHDAQLDSLLELPQRPQQQQQQQTADLGRLLQQQALKSQAAGSNSSSIESSPAYARLQYLLAQVVSEFRKFAAGNRLSLYHLHTLNLETGSLGVPPPAGHWKKVAQLMRDKLPQQVLSDICVARQLYSNAVVSITHQRRMLFVQLQRLLERYSYMGNYNIDSVIVNLDGPHCEGVAILDAIDTNLRKEYTLEGVFQWMVRKLMPPLLAAEITVHSYPHIADFHSILTELVNLVEQVPALTALQELQLQQLKSMQQQQQQDGQEQLQRQQQYEQQQQQQLFSPTGARLSTRQVDGAAYYGGQQQPLQQQYQQHQLAYSDSGQLQSPTGQQYGMATGQQLHQQPPGSWQAPMLQQPAGAWQTPHQQQQTAQLQQDGSSWQDVQQQQLGSTWQGQPPPYQQQLRANGVWQAQQQQQQQVPSSTSWQAQEQQQQQQVQAGGTWQDQSLLGANGSQAHAQHAAPAVYY